MDHVLLRVVDWGGAVLVRRKRLGHFLVRDLDWGKAVWFCVVELDIRRPACSSCVFSFGSFCTTPGGATFVNTAARGMSNASGVRPP